VVSLRASPLPSGGEGQGEGAGQFQSKSQNAVHLANGRRRWPGGVRGVTPWCKIPFDVSSRPPGHRWVERGVVAMKRHSFRQSLQLAEGQKRRGSQARNRRATPLRPPIGIGEEWDIFSREIVGFSSFGPTNWRRGQHSMQQPPPVFPCIDVLPFRSWQSWHYYPRSC
jgi:hypothetical protein